MSTGGRGFGVLLWNGDRLAYLQPWPWGYVDLPTRRSGGPYPRDNRRWKLYQLEPKWKELGDSPRWLEVMQEEIEAGRMTLFRLITTPTGKIRRYDLDIQETVLTFPAPEELMFVTPDGEQLVSSVPDLANFSQNSNPSSHTIHPSGEIPSQQTNE